jgi:prepilin-type N-terminal cleavage/methylation domain-containing protein
MKKLACGKSSGFTLVELLVVVAIIALLMMMLMPWVDRARFQAGVTACRSNLNQWGIATNTYAADNQGKLPRFNYVGGANGCTWDYGHGFWPTGFVAYGISPSMYFCPLDTTEWARLQYVGHHGASDWWMYRSYIYWVGRSGGATGGLRPKQDANEDGNPEEPPLRISDAPPATTASVSPRYAIMSDGIITDNGSFTQTLDQARVNYGDGGHWYRNRVENINVLFADGRIETRRRNQIRLRVVNPYPLRSWY